MDEPVKDERLEGVDADQYRWISVPEYNTRVKFPKDTPNDIVQKALRERFPHKSGIIESAVDYTKKAVKQGFQQFGKTFDQGLGETPEESQGVGKKELQQRSQLYKQKPTAEGAEDIQASEEEVRTGRKALDAPPGSPLHNQLNLDEAIRGASMATGSALMGQAISFPAAPLVGLAEDFAHYVNSKDWKGLSKLLKQYAFGSPDPTKNLSPNLKSSMIGQQMQAFYGDPSTQEYAEGTKENLNDSLKKVDTKNLYQGLVHFMKSGDFNSAREIASYIQKFPEKLLKTPEDIKLFNRIGDFFGSYLGMSKKSLQAAAEYPYGEKLYAKIHGEPEGVSVKQQEAKAGATAQAGQDMFKAGINADRQAMIGADEGTPPETLGALWSAIQGEFYGVMSLGMIQGKAVPKNVISRLQKSVDNINRVLFPREMESHVPSGAVMPKTAPESPIFTPIPVIETSPTMDRPVFDERQVGKGYKGAPREINQAMIGKEKQKALASDSELQMFTGLVAWEKIFKKQPEEAAKFNAAEKEATRMGLYKLDNANQGIWDKIRQDTGWWKGVDGKWAKEISDKDIQLAMSTDDILKLAAENPGKGIRLDQLIKNADKLFELYPDIKDAEIVPALRSSHDPVTNQVSIDIESFLRGDSIIQLVHELNHSIQDKEGFMRGGGAKASPGFGLGIINRDKIKSFYEAGIRRTNKFMDNYEGGTNSIYIGTKALDSLKKQYDFFMKEIYNAKPETRQAAINSMIALEKYQKSEKAIVQNKNQQQNISGTNKEETLLSLKKQEKILLRQSDDLMKQWNNYTHLESLFKDIEAIKVLHSIYMLYGGEEMAFRSMVRSNMSEAELAATAPWKTELTSNETMRNAFNMKEHPDLSMMADSITPDYIINRRRGLDVNQLTGDKGEMKPWQLSKEEFLASAARGRVPSKVIMGENVPAQIQAVEDGTRPLSMLDAGVVERYYPVLPDTMQAIPVTGKGVTAFVLKDNVEKMMPTIKAIGDVIRKPNKTPLDHIKLGQLLGYDMDDINAFIAKTSSYEAMRADSLSQGESPVPLFRTKSGAKDVTLDATGLQTAYEMVRDHLKSMWKWLDRKPEWSNFKGYIGDMMYARNVAEADMLKWVKEIRDIVPSKVRREAIINYIQAGGDQTLIAQRARWSKEGKSFQEFLTDKEREGLSPEDLEKKKYLYEKYKDNVKKNSQFNAGYDTALHLTQDERNLAERVIDYYADKLEEAQDAGVMEDFVDNYVNQLWDRRKWVGGNAVKSLKAQAGSGLLNLKPREALRRVHQSYFDGEQAGLTPRNKDIAFLMAAYDRSITKAITSRRFVDALATNMAKDGRPLTILGGKSVLNTENKMAIVDKRTGKVVRVMDNPDDATGWANDKGRNPDNYDFVVREKKTRVVTPNPPQKIKIKVDGEIIDEYDTKGYKPIDHPSLKDYKWVGTDESGSAVIFKGDMYIHPEILDHMRSLLGSSTFRTIKPEYSVGKKAMVSVARSYLELQGRAKGTMLGLSGFHQVHMAQHALTHASRPAFAPHIDLHDPITEAGVRHGLMLSDPDSMSIFAEGAGSRKALIDPGGYLTKYSEYMFGYDGYVPRVKHNMYRNVLEKNMERYKNTLTEDEIQYMSAEQANAAFGELNWKMMKWHPTVIDVMRFGFLAPDFLFARGKFAAQALRGYGEGVVTGKLKNEQFMALAIRGATSMYLLARGLNYASTGDPHFEWEKMFSVILPKKGMPEALAGKEITIRSVQGDILHAVRDINSFVWWRLNPFGLKMAVELLTHRDEYGRYADMVDTLTDTALSVVPIPFQKSSDFQIYKNIMKSCGVTMFDEQTRFENELMRKNRERLVVTIPRGSLKEQALHIGERDRYERSFRYADQIRKRTNQNRSYADIEQEIIKDLRGDRIAGVPKLYEEDRKRINRLIKEDRKENYIRSLCNQHIEDVVSLWHAANDDEKAKYFPMLNKAMFGFIEKHPERYAKIKDQWNELVIDMQHRGLIKKADLNKQMEPVGID